MNRNSLVLSPVTWISATSGIGAPTRGLGCLLKTSESRTGTLGCQREKSVTPRLSPLTSSFRSTENLDLTCLCPQAARTLPQHLFWPQPPAPASPTLPASCAQTSPEPPRLPRAPAPGTGPRHFPPGFPAQPSQGSLTSCSLVQLLCWALQALKIIPNPLSSLTSHFAPMGPFTTSPAGAPPFPERFPLPSSYSFFKVSFKFLLSYRVS